MINIYNEELQNNSEGWEDLSKLMRRLTVLELTDLMDDALANGFEFKLQGSHIYYRECTE